VMSAHRMFEEPAALNVVQVRMPETVSCSGVAPLRDLMCSAWGQIRIVIYRRIVKMT
jgi:hypothetical protein